MVMGRNWGWNERGLRWWARVVARSLGKSATSALGIQTRWTTTDNTLRGRGMERVPIPWERPSRTQMEEDAMVLGAEFPQLALGKGG